MRAGRLRVVAPSAAVRQPMLVTRLLCLRQPQGPIHRLEALFLVLRLLRFLRFPILVPNASLCLTLFPGVLRAFWVLVLFLILIPPLLRDGAATP